MNKFILLVFFAIANIVLASMLIRLSETGPVSSGAFRLLLSIPMLAILDWSKPKSTIKYPLNISIISASCLAGLFFALDLAFFNVSLLATTLAEATLLTNMVPFVMAPISIFYFKEKISPKFLITVALAIGGLILLTHDKNLTAQHLSGDWLALLSAVFYAFFLTSIKTARSQYPASRVMMLACAVGGLVLAILALAKHEVLFPQSAYGWLILLLVAFNGQVLGQTLMAYAVKFIPLQLASLFLLLSPIVAAIYAYVFFQEYLSVSQMLGIGIILVAVYYGKLILENSIKKTTF